MSTNRWFQSLAVAFLLTAGLPAAFAARSSQAQATMVDVNTASQKDLEALPGIGAVTAKKIIAGRPYSSVGDLSRAGVSAATMDKIRSLVTAGRSSSQAMPPQQRGDASRSTRNSPVPPNLDIPVDLNTASQKELEKLPAIGFFTARKIVAGRPYNSVDDLSRAGVSAGAIAKIRGLVAVSARPRTTRSSPRDSSPSPRPVPSQRDDREPPAGEPRQTAPPQTANDRGAPEPPSQRSTPVAPRAGSGMVWVNKDTKVFHREGDHWYGNTVHGAYMTEEDAVNAGYRESKQKGKPQ
jgi:DNA uptake protein ComE-like DNA-binding protein